MLDMNNFTLTKKDEELGQIISPVKQNSNQHKILAQWAIKCLERVLPLFKNKYPEDSPVLDAAVSNLQKWMAGDMKMWDARKYTYTVLALAKKIEKEDKPYAQIVRATSHCLATCHVPTHAEGTAMYVVSAIKLINKGSANVLKLMEDERTWQIARLKELMQKCVNGGIMIFINYYEIRPCPDFF